MDNQNIESLKQYITSLKGSVKENQSHVNIWSGRVKDNRTSLSRAKKDLAKLQKVNQNGTKFKRGLMHMTRLMSKPFVSVHNNAVMFLDHPEKFMEAKMTKSSERLLNMKADNFKPNTLKTHILEMVGLVVEIEKYVGQHPMLVSQHGLLDLRDKLEVKINHLRPPITTSKEIEQTKEQLEKITDTIVNEITKLGDKQHA